MGMAFTLFFRRDLPRRTGLVSMLLGCGAVVLVLLEFMGGEISARFTGRDRFRRLGKPAVGA